MLLSMTDGKFVRENKNATIYFKNPPLCLSALQCQFQFYFPSDKDSYCALCPYVSMCVFCEALQSFILHFSLMTHFP